jgi:hypothetical protein
MRPPAAIPAILLAMAAALLGAYVGAGAVNADALIMRTPGGGSNYPQPVRSRGGALRLCPSAAGLVPFTAAASAAARSISLSYGRVSLSRDLADSDRAWQPSVRAMWAGHSPAASQDVRIRGVSGGGATPYRVIVRRSCGGALISRSLAVTVGPLTQPGEAECDACAETLFFVDRHGRALIYFVH